MEYTCSCPPCDCSFAEPLGHGEGASVEFASWNEVLEAVDALCEEFFRSLEPRQECEAVGSVPARQLVPRMRDADGPTSNMEVLNGNAARTIKPSLVDEVFGADTDV